MFSSYSLLDSTVQTVAHVGSYLYLSRCLYSTTTWNLRVAELAVPVELRFYRFSYLRFRADARDGRTGTPRRCALALFVLRACTCVWSWVSKDCSLAFALRVPFLENGFELLKSKHTCTLLV